MTKTLALLLGCILLTACNSDSGSKTASTASATSVAPAPVSSAADSAASSSSAVSQEAGFTGNNLRLIGRFDTAESGKARFTWPGSAMEFVFEGTHAAIEIQADERTRFEVQTGDQQHTLWVTPGAARYTLAENLPQGVHQLRLTRVSESFNNVSTFLSDPLVDGHLLAAPEAPARRLLVIGDSITAGYGVEGDSHECKFSLDTSSQQLTYAAMAAHNLNADLHAIAWSGIGAWRSYGEETPDSPTILVRYARTLANDETSQWDATRYQPDAIIINIGTNDFWQGSVSDEYREAMASLIAMVQNDHPQKPVYLMLSPMLSGDPRSAQAEIFSTLTQQGVYLLDAGKIEPQDGLGCDYPPNLTTQTRLADALSQRLASDLGW